MADQSQAAVAEAPVVAEPQRRAQPKRRPKPKRQPPYHVILWDDDDHSYPYVITMMRELFGHPVPKGYEIARTVDSAGRAIVLTTTRDHAELKRDQIHAYGKDDLIDGCKGSMKASIEPAPPA